VLASVRMNDGTPFTVPYIQAIFAVISISHHKTAIVAVPHFDVVVVVAVNMGPETDVKYAKILVTFCIQSIENKSK
jgi:hypothetical protein